MFTSESGKLRSIENQLADQQKQSWAMLVVGITLGFVGMHFLMARPLSRELARMQRDLTIVEQRMQDLVGARDDVWETNSLLSSLKAQHGQTEESRIALQSIRELRSALIDEATRNTDAISSLELLSKLQEKLIAGKPITAEADGALDKMRSIEEQLVAQKDSNGVASESLGEIISIKTTVSSQSASVAQAKDVLDNLKKIGEQLAGQKDSTDQAAVGLKGLVELKTGLSKAAENLEVAQSVSDQLVGLQSRLAEGGLKADIATENAAKLVAINERLNRADLDLASSQENLAGLLKVQDTLVDRSKSVADAIQVLELLGGFHDEFVSQIQVLGEMRRNLLEISLMDNTIARISKMMQPLVELGNLKRLSDEELRQAARLILDGRTATRVTKNQTDARQLPVESNLETPSNRRDLVPLPVENE